MSKTTALHVHHAFWYISLTSTARQRRESSQCDFLCQQHADIPFFVEPKGHWRTDALTVSRSVNHASILDDIKQVDAEQWQDWTPCAQPCHRPRPPLESINVGHYVIYMNTSSTAKNRGVWFADEFLSMDKQVKWVDDIYFLAQGNIYRLLTARS